MTVRPFNFDPVAAVNAQTDEALAGLDHAKARDEIDRLRDYAVELLTRLNIVKPFDPVAHTGLVTVTAGEYEHMRAELAAWRAKFALFHYAAELGKVGTRDEDGAFIA